MDIQVGFIFKLDVGESEPATLRVADIGDDDIVAEFLDGKPGWENINRKHSRLISYVPVGRERYWYVYASDIHKFIKRYGIVEQSETYQIY